jgi:hypothetical protein
LGKGILRHTKFVQYLILQTANFKVLSDCIGVTNILIQRLECAFLFIVLSRVLVKKLFCYI